MTKIGVEIARILDVRYDLICPIGQCCAVALYLEQFGLRKMSLPFDWMFGDALDLCDYVRILQNRFESFMLRENLVRTGEEGEYALYRDEGTGFVSMHDFKRELPFEVAMPLVRAKFVRRIERLYQSVETSKDVLFVHLARAYVPKAEMLLESLSALRARFPRQNVQLLVLSHEPCEGVSVARIGEGLCLVRGRFWDAEVSRRFGNKPLGECVFSQLRTRGWLANVISQRLLRTTARFRTMFHLTSAGRRRARQRLFDAQTRCGE